MFDNSKDELIIELKKDKEYLQQRLDILEKRLLAITDPAAFARTYPREIPSQPRSNSLSTHRPPSTPANMRQRIYQPQPGEMTNEEIQESFRITEKTR